LFLGSVKIAAATTGNPAFAETHGKAHTAAFCTVKGLCRAFFNTCTAIVLCRASNTAHGKEIRKAENLNFFLCRASSSAHGKHF
jgi:hypothetical protein